MIFTSSSSSSSCLLRARGPSSSFVGILHRIRPMPGVCAFPLCNPFPRCKPPGHLPRGARVLCEKRRAVLDIDFFTQMKVVVEEVVVGTVNTAALVGETGTRTGTLVGVEAEAAAVAHWWRSISTVAKLSSFMYLNAYNLLRSSCVQIILFLDEQRKRGVF